MSDPSSTPETLNDLQPITPDGRAERLAELKRLFPDLFTNEGRLNPDELRQLVEPNEVHDTEGYESKWYGKAASKREAFDRLRNNCASNWEKVRDGLKELYGHWEKDDPQRPLARFTKVDEMGPNRDEWNFKHFNAF